MHILYAQITRHETTPNYYICACPAYCSVADDCVFSKIRKMKRFCGFDSLYYIHNIMMMLLLMHSKIGKKHFDANCEFKQLICSIINNNDHTWIEKGKGICTNPPSVTGYSRPHGTSVSSYKFTWKSARCQDGSILQYQLQFAESCSITLPVTLITGNNATSTTVVIPACSATDCYVRIRAELRDGSFTDFSTCVQINNQFVEYERELIFFDVNTTWLPNIKLIPGPDNFDYRANWMVFSRCMCSHSRWMWHWISIWVFH